MGRVLWGSLDGFSLLFEGQWMRNELLNSLLFTVVASISCWYVTKFIQEHLKNSIVTCILLIPGLCGSLLLGLATIYIFSGITFLKSSVIPLALALILYALPISLLMQYFLIRQTKDSTLHAAEILPTDQSNKLIWSIKTLPKILMSFPIFCYVWFDLTLSSMLAPATMPGIFPRLYNLMHYNENGRLSATVFVIVFIPIVIYSFFLIISKLFNQWQK